MKKNIAAALIVTAGLASTSSHALTVTFGGVNPGDGSFLTSALTPNNQSNPAAGIFIDTFDRPTGGCGLNSAALGVSTTGNFRLTTGSWSTAAAPANDQTCYASGPNVLRNAPSDNTVTIDFATALANNFPGRKIDYLGFYWGSIDAFNDITFFANGVPITIASLNGVALGRTVLDGSDVLNFGGTSGDRTDPNTNRYVNIFFDGSEQFDSLVFRSTQYAMEIDNVVTRVAANAVPEPSAILLIGAGLLGLGASSRRRKLTES